MTFLRFNFSAYLTSHNIIEFLFLSLYSFRDHALKSALIYHISFCSCLTIKTPLRVIVVSMHIISYSLIIITRFLLKKIHCMHWCILWAHTPIFIVILSYKVCCLLGPPSILNIFFCIHLFAISN